MLVTHEYIEGRGAEWLLFNEFDSDLVLTPIHSIHHDTTYALIQGVCF